MRKIGLLLLFVLSVGSIIAQDLSKLTPEQLALYKKYTSGNTSTKNAMISDTVPERTMSPESKQGYPVDETNQKYKTDETNQKYNADETNQKSLIDYIKFKTAKPKLKVFGSEIFSKQNLTFEPRLNIPTPPYYILGTYDEMNVDISGNYDVNYKVKVNPDGTVRIPNLGPIKVSGLTIEDASRLIKNQVSKIYAGVSSGATRVNVSLGNIRSIRVTVIGEAFRPGSYTVPSLATAFNALYACGGPGEFGSMRDIKVIRHGKMIADIDVYNFLLDGSLKNNVALQDEDVIKVEPTRLRISIEGAVKHGGIFEALDGETLQQLVRFTGGFADNAYKGRITVFRLTEKEKTVVDVIENEIPTFKLKSGDSCSVSTTFDKYDNRVDIKGSVYRPGAYALEPGLTVKKLIEKAAGVKEEAYLNMAYITRKKENQIPEIIGFNLGEVLNGNAPDVLLQKDDSVAIRSLFEYREGQSVTITGEVKMPGVYPLIQNITLKDLIFKARGFTELASTDSIELIRPIKNQDSLLVSNRKSFVLKFALDKDLNFKKGMGDILLENGDQVVVRSISGFEGLRMVTVDGEVIHPGSYNITSKSERISDVIRRAGGFTHYAYPLGAYLIRTEKLNAVEQKLNKIIEENSKEQLGDKANKNVDVKMLKETGTNSIQNLDSLKKNLSGANSVKKIFTQEGIVGINLTEIMNNPGGKYDLILEEGDIINVPRELQTVRVLGKVLFPTYVYYDQNLKFKDYISNAGGFSQNANRSKAFVIYPNGTAKSTRNVLGILVYPNVKPGSRIVIPEIPIELKNNLTPGEIISIMSSVSSVAALIYSVVRK